MFSIRGAGAVVGSCADAKNAHIAWMQVTRSIDCARTFIVRTKSLTLTVSVLLQEDMSAENSTNLEFEF